MSIIESSQSSWVLSDIKEVKKTTKIGKDIMAFCSKCRANRSHVIVTLVAGTIDKPDKVQCNSCKTERKYRPPKEDGDIVSIKKTGEKKVAEYDGEYDIDDIEVPSSIKVDEKKKAKPKKPKSQTSAASSKKELSTLPLSMQKLSFDDQESFKNKSIAFKTTGSLARAYKAIENFKVGEVIDHKTFGLGFILEISGITKITVLFQEGRKLLVCAPPIKN